MSDINSLLGCDPGALYEWLKNAIISCRYIVPGHDTLREIKLKTIAMLRKMLDPDGVCGHKVSETVNFRRLAQHCSYLFANTAGELICQWTEGDNDAEPHLPAASVDETVASVGQKVGEVAKAVEDHSLNPPGNEVPGSKPFVCRLPLPKHEIENLNKDDENVVKCPHHGPENNLVDCVFCHARQQQLIEKAEVVCKKIDKRTDVHDVKKVFHPLPSTKEIPLVMWMSKNAKTSDKGWMVPQMVGIESLRMEIPSPDTPLARWRINLRECLSYTFLVICPGLMSHEFNKEWTDMQCIGVLEQLQDTYNLCEGTIPASVFAVAINHFTTHALDEGHNASQSADGGDHPALLTHEDVESWGLRPRLPPPRLIRKRKIFLLTDSGALIYRRPPLRKKGTTKKVPPSNYLNNDTCTEPRDNIIANYDVGGADWSRWAVFLQTFIANHSGIMEMCSDGVKRFPSHVSVIVIDNLNGTGVDYESEEAKKGEDQRMTLDKFVDDVEKQAAIKLLMELLNQFKSAVYCQTAPAKHWGMREVVNELAEYIRMVARGWKIATLDSTQFWSSIKPFMGPAQLPPREGENAVAAVPDEDVVHWHHCELGETQALPYHWDRFIFRLACYMETSLIHESVKKIFDMGLTKATASSVRPRRTS